ncbi:hypothetical protein X975_08000, partial [Stegodyphus mimosarum]
MICLSMSASIYFSLRTVFSKFLFFFALSPNILKENILRSHAEKKPSCV